MNAEDYLIALDAVRWVTIAAGCALTLSALLHLRARFLHPSSSEQRATQQQTAAVAALGVAGVLVAVEEVNALGDPLVEYRLGLLVLLAVLGLWALLSRSPWE